MPVVTIEIGTKPVRVLAKNPKRLFWFILNNSQYNVYVGFDSNVSISGKTKGIQLDANGGWIEDDKHKGEVWAISEGKAEITVVESSEGE